MNIPIINIDVENNLQNKKEVGAQVFQCLVEHGYFFVKNTIFNDEYVLKLFNEFNVFFDLSSDIKNLLSSLCRFKNNLISAYLEVGKEQINYSDEKENKEVLELWTENGYNTDYICKILKCENVVSEQNVWSSLSMMQIRKLLFHAYEQGAGYIYFLSECLSLYLQEEEKFFSKNFGNNNNFRITRSVLLNQNTSVQSNKESIRIGAHEDHGCFTCVLHEPGYDSGFQVYNKQSGWQKLVRQKDMIYIHGGNMLSLWTNGKVPATLHRVVDPGWKNNRHAINLFVGTNQDVIVNPISSCVDDTDIKSVQFVAKDIYKITTNKHAMHLLDDKEPK